jgi:endonuclease G
MAGILIIAFLLSNCSPSLFTTNNQDQAPTAQLETSAPTIQADISGVSAHYRPYIPEVSLSHFVLDYSGFVLEFDTLHRNARWVCYMLCEAKLGDGVERSSGFRMESRLGIYSPRDAEYRNSGFDRGHLAPAADMSYSEKAMYDSFFLSNVSPQLPGFNRGIWKRLEERVRSIAIEKDTIWVVTGPILEQNLGKMGSSSVSIPEIFYKVIYKPSSDGGKGIAFLMRNQSATGDLSAFAVTIDSVERLSGINFFPSFEPSKSQRVEKELDLAYWLGDN